MNCKIVITRPSSLGKTPLKMSYEFDNERVAFAIETLLDSISDVVSDVKTDENHEK